MMKNLPAVHMFQILSKIESNYNDARESHLKQKSRHTIQICSESIVEKKGEKKKRNKRKLISCSNQIHKCKGILSCWNAFYAQVMDKWISRKINVMTEACTVCIVFNTKLKQQKHKPQTEYNECNLL